MGTVSVIRRSWNDTLEEEIIMAEGKINFADKTGQLRSEQSLEEALDVVKKEIVKADFSNPTLFLQLPIIKEALELYLKLVRRKKKNL